jgi:uncharacterized protein (TIGR03437 family)
MRSSSSLGFAILSILLALNAVAQSSGTFVATGSMTTARTGHTATLLKDGSVLITGGFYDNALNHRVNLASAELYDPSTGTFTPTGNLTTARFDHTATLLSDGRVLIVGDGVPGRAVPAELYDPVTGTFSATSLAPFHFHPSTSLLSNGKVLIAGGPTAELYDPATSAFTPAGAVDNYGISSAALLPDGRILIPGTGGVSLYNITADSLQLVTTLPGSYAYQTTTLLSNGKVLIAGGEGSDLDRTIKDASLYDLHRGTLAGTGLLLFSRDFHTATLLPGGRVLIVGGYDGDAYDTGVPLLTEAEVYDPSTGSFTSAGSLISLRDGHTATLLNNGRVLVAGGTAGSATAELYIPPTRAASAASLIGPLAPESLASLFGSRLAPATEVADPLSPPTSLGGISLRVRDSSGAVRLAPLLYVSPSQINFEVPAGTAPGNVTLEVMNASVQLAPAAAQVNAVAPGLFAFEDNTVAAFALRIEPDGKQTVLSVQTSIVLDDRPVYLVLYATGIRNRSSLANVQVTIGGMTLPVEYAGPNGSSVPGLDQVNVRLTSALKGTGVANLILSADGIPSNSVSVDVR